MRTLLVSPPRRIDLTIAQGFGFVVPARARGNTRCISSTRAGATEPKNKRAAGQHALGAALVIALCITFGCVGTRTGNPGNNDDPTGISVAQSTLERDRAPSVSPDDASNLAAARRRFALEMYRQLATEPGNLFFSPHSISMALAMTFAGAKGETEAQMADALHFTLEQPVLHAALNFIDLELAKRKTQTAEPMEFAADAFELSMVNRAWGQTGFPFDKTYLDVLATNYGTGLFSIDFGDSNASRELINDWVSEQTERRVQELLPDGSLDSDTVFVLTNTIYFKASWKHRFDPAKTMAGSFASPVGARDVLMMNTVQPFEYAEADGFQAVSIPFLSDSVRMLLLLPPSGSFDEAVRKLDVTLVERLIGSTSMTMVMLKLPKWSFQTEYRLKAPLRALGMQDAFMAGVADLSGIGGSPGALWVDEVYHKSLVAVDERGTEAASASGVVGRRGSLPNSVSISFDRPFVFLVYDAPTSQILFFGHLVDPTES